VSFYCTFGFGEDIEGFLCEKEDLYMSSTKDNAIQKAKQLIGLLKSNGIDVSEAYLFGSAALNKGEANTAI